MRSFDELKQDAIRLCYAVMGFVVTKKPGDIVLVTLSERELRYAFVTPEEAAPYVESVKPPGEVLAELKQDPVAMNNGDPGFFWLVAAMPGNACVYFTLKAAPVISQQGPAN